MSLGKKLLLGIGAVIGLLGVIGVLAPPPVATKSTAPKAVLGIQTQATPTKAVTTPTPTEAPRPTVSPSPTPLLTPISQPAATPVPSGQGYVNVDSNFVPSPTHAPAPPAGATAICRDGTYSFSQHRSGTCSYHDGVATWL